MVSVSDDKDVTLNLKGGGSLAIMMAKVEGLSLNQVLYTTTLAQGFRVTQDLSTHDPVTQPPLQECRQDSRKGYMTACER